MQWQDHIVHDPSICHGKATIKGTRILVFVILDNLADGETFEQIRLGYPPISDVQIRACLSYAAWLAHDEIVARPQVNTA